MSLPRLNQRRLRRLLTLLATLIVLTIAAAQTTELPSSSPSHSSSPLGRAVSSLQPGLYPVVHINDGDTIIVRLPDGHEETVRLLGVDTPEVKDPRKPVQCFGEAASAHTKARLTGAAVRLEPDPEDTDRDKYGRLLRYVYLPDGTLYNAELIRDGYGFAYTVFPITKLDDFRALEADARSHNRGLWAGCNIDSSSEIKQTLPKSP
ncbi:MAG TPA: thermonuclease family protein [Candidatus Saccharimonas sp.]|nr:thermonuclease family protein [Candidatus Saccharimonas sp.]